MAGAQRTAGAFGTQEGVGVSSGFLLQRSQLRFGYCLGDTFSFLPPTFRRGRNGHYISEESTDRVVISVQFQKALRLSKTIQGQSTFSTSDVQNQIL